MSRYRAALIWLWIATLALVGCAGKGLISEQSNPEDFHIEKTLTDFRVDSDAPFIVYGDNRPGWRAREKFWKKDAWVTWWQLLIPFYQIYLLGNGVVGGINYLRHVPDDGGKEARMVRDAMYAHAQKDGMTFFVNTGDMATDGRRPKHWRTFVEQNRDEVPLAVDYELLPVIGNHEQASDPIYGGPNYEAAFDYPAFYVFETPNMDLFVVDSDMAIDQHDNVDDETLDMLYAKWFESGDPDNPGWLERELAKSDKPFKTVFMHHPPVAFGKHYYDWSVDGYGRNLEARRTQIVELMRRHGVRVVFCGHQHLYERNTVLYDDGNNIEIVITGGGGSPLHEGFSEERTEEAIAAYAKSGLKVQKTAQAVVYNYVVVQATTDAIEVTAYEVSKKEEHDGRVIDTFRIEN